MLHLKVRRGEVFLQEQKDGSTGLVVVPENGEPAGCILEPKELARLASESWGVALKAKRRAVKQRTVTVRARRKRRAGR